MYKVLLIAILFCIAETGFAKKQIHLQAQTRCPQLSVEAFIDENNKDLTLSIKEGLLDVKVLVTDMSGRIICYKEIHACTIVVLELPMIDHGEYVLSIFNENVKMQGHFNIL